MCVCVCVCVCVYKDFMVLTELNCAFTRAC